MASPRNTFYSEPNPEVPGFRKKLRKQDGWYADFKSTWPYSTVFEVVRGSCYNPLNGVRTAYDAGNAPGAFQVPTHKTQSTYNAAYARASKSWKGATLKAGGDTADFGALIGEYRQSSRMVKNAADNLYRYTKILAGRYKRAKRSRHRRRRLTRKFADYWLEYSFGWAPIFGTLYSGMKAMSNDVTPRHFMGSASCLHEGHSGSGNPRHDFLYQLVFRIFGYVSVSNPNVALANSLGLVNPASVAWELTKWSFVVDWLCDMGSWIDSWSDQFGFSITNAGVSKIQTGSTTQSWTALLGTSKSTSLVATRDVGISLPLPNLDVMKNIGDNLKRAANSLALTMQLLSGDEVRFKRRGRGR